MTTLYLLSGLFVCLILAWNSRNIESDSSITKRTFHLLLAVSLTTLFWPLVLAMAYFNGFNAIKNKRIKLESDDLIQPVNFQSIENNNVLPQENSFANSYNFEKLNNQWNSLKQKKRKHNSLWSFKTDDLNSSKQEVYEGYALVDNDKNIIDYVIIDSYRREEKTSHLFH